MTIPPKKGLQTLALHAGHEPEKEGIGSRAVPIYQTTSFVFRDTEHAANLFALKESGFIYTRIMNPTTDVLEQRLAAMHEGIGALATASGMSAIFFTIGAIASAGQNIVSGSNLYGGTINLFHHVLPRFGIEVRFVDSSDPANFAAQIDKRTRLLFTEAIGNPRCNVDDLAGIGKVAHEHDIPFVVDNTASPPPLSNPFSYGADIAVYSLTKMIGGHGTSIGGALIEKGDFDWSKNNKFPEITDPDTYSHAVGLKPQNGKHEGKETLLTPSLIATARTGLLRDIGAALSPFNSFLILQGIETLPLRAKTHCENAMKVAQHLEQHPAVSWVNYAGLPSHPNHERARHYFPLGPGAVFGFGIKGGLPTCRKFIESVELCSHLANILDAKTLVIHPASTTHAQLSAKELAACGVMPDMVRISVGIEDLDDILQDINLALQASRKI